MPVCGCVHFQRRCKDIFGIQAEVTDIYAGELNQEGYKSVAKQLSDKFGFQKVVVTSRESLSASDNGWSTMRYEVWSTRCSVENPPKRLLSLLQRHLPWNIRLKEITIWSLYLKWKSWQVWWFRPHSALSYSVDGINIHCVPRFKLLIPSDDVISPIYEKTGFAGEFQRDINLFLKQRQVYILAGWRCLCW